MSKRQRMVTLRIPLGIAPLVRGAISFGLEAVRGWPGVFARDHRELSLALAGVADDLGHAIDAARAKAEKLGGGKRR